MAYLKRIDELYERLDKIEPAWIRGYTPHDKHLSGHLREVGDATGAFEVLFDETAETLDDAHEDWLELVNALRDLTNDAERSGFGPSSRGRARRLLERLGVKA